MLKSRLLLIALSVVLYIQNASAAPGTKVGAIKKKLQPEQHIVGGVTTDISEYPYQVSVRLDTYMLLHICGGSIYAPRVVLTAAHCIKGRFASYIRIVAGSNTIADESEQGHYVSKLIPHVGYNKNTKENDIGLIILTSPLVYTPKVQPIRLATQEPAAGSKAIITGWGKRDEDAETLTNLLQMTDIKIVDSQVCKSKYLTKNYVISEQMLCAGSDEGGKDTCQGDSGGPMTVDGVLVGVVSWGIGCARDDYPGVYASVVYHTKWIQESAKPYL